MTAYALKNSVGTMIEEPTVRNGMRAFGDAAHWAHWTGELTRSVGLASDASIIGKIGGAG